MNLTLISAAIAAAVGFGSAWQIQNWRNLEDENNRIAQQRAAEQELSRMEQKRSAAALDAANAARLRERKLRVDAATAVAAADSLRDALASSVQAARDDPGSCPDRTAATSELFTQCSQELTTLAGRCDRHVSDLKTMMETFSK